MAEDDDSIIQSHSESEEKKEARGKSSVEGGDDRGLKPILSGLLNGKEGGCHDHE